MFSKIEVKEIVELFRVELGMKVSEEEACQHAEQLVDLLRVTFRTANDFSDTKPP